MSIMSSSGWFFGSLLRPRFEDGHIINPDVKYLKKWKSIYARRTSFSHDLSTPCSSSLLFGYRCSLFRFYFKSRTQIDRTVRAEMRKFSVSFPSLSSVWFLFLIYKFAQRLWRISLITTWKILLNSFTIESHVLFCDFYCKNVTFSNCFSLIIKL